MYSTQDFLWKPFPDENFVINRFSWLMDFLLQCEEKKVVCYVLTDIASIKTL